MGSNMRMTLACQRIASFHLVWCCKSVWSPRRAEKAREAYQIVQRHVFCIAYQEVKYSTRSIFHCTHCRSPGTWSWKRLLPELQLKHCDSRRLHGPLKKVPPFQEASGHRELRQNRGYDATMVGAICHLYVHIYIYIYIYIREKERKREREREKGARARGATLLPIPLAKERERGVNS